MKASDSAVTLAELSERAAKKAKTDARSAKSVISSLFSAVADELLSEEQSKLSGFGAFKKVFVEKSTGRNPSNGESIEISERWKIKFTPMPAAAARINKPYARLKPKPLPDEDEAAEKTEAVESEPILQDEPVPAVEAAPAPLPESAPPESAPRAAEGVIQSQTVESAVINSQVIQRQVVQNQVIQQTVAPAPRDDDYDIDYDIDDESDGESAARRCWFFAGVAVALTAIVAALMAFVLARPRPPAARPPERSALESRARSEPPRARPAPSPKAEARAAEGGGVYADIAEKEYGSRALWPYVYSANMLRRPDPDRPAARKNIIVPPMPDARIDRKDIEFSVIDVYNAYRSLVEKEPRGRAAKIRRERAVSALVCGETLYPGFISAYAVRFDDGDVKEARAALR